MAHMTFEEWRRYKQMVMGETPGWFDDPAECRRRFEAYRVASVESCSALSPAEVVPAPPRRPMPLPSSQMHECRASVRQRIWVAVFALIMQFAMLAAPAFAGGDVVVNGSVLSNREQSSLEAVVGPLSAGAYWLEENGDFGRMGSNEPFANIIVLVQRQFGAARENWVIQQQSLRERMLAEMIQNAMRQRWDAHRGYIYGNTFSGGWRDARGRWGHYNGYDNFAVGGTADGCIYTSGWSNC